MTDHARRPDSRLHTTLLPLRCLARRVRQARVRWKLSRLAGPALLRGFARANPRARFIQVGANDGRMMDPIRETIVASLWSGLVIEPVPRLFDALTENYRSCADRVHALNVAIAADGAPGDFYHLQEVPGLPPLPDWAQGLGTFRRNVILKHSDRIPDIERYLATIRVPCLSLRQAWDRNAGGRLDLLAVDTEGYDFEIVKQLDFHHLAPALIVYEHHHFDAVTRQSCIALLRSQNYLMFEEGLDTWCLKAGDPRSERLARRWPRIVRRSDYAVRVGVEN